jgi:hypothetical protein
LFCFTRFPVYFLNSGDVIFPFSAFVPPPTRAAACLRTTRRPT